MIKPIKKVIVTANVAALSVESYIFLYLFFRDSA